MIKKRPNGRMRRQTHYDMRKEINRIIDTRTAEELHALINSLDPEELIIKTKDKDGFECDILDCAPCAYMKEHDAKSKEDDDE